LRVDWADIVSQFESALIRLAVVPRGGERARAGV